MEEKEGEDVQTAVKVLAAEMFERKRVVVGYTDFLLIRRSMGDKVFAKWLESLMEASDNPIVVMVDSSENSPTYNLATTVLAQYPVKWSADRQRGWFGELLFDLYEASQRSVRVESEDWKTKATFTATGQDAEDIIL